MTTFGPENGCRPCGRASLPAPGGHRGPRPAASVAARPRPDPPRCRFREVGPDNLVGRITLDAVRAEIPVGHRAVQIKHVDGVVGDILDQQPELLLVSGFASGHPRSPCVRSGPGDLGIADDTAGLVADRIDDDICPETGAVLADPPAFAFELPGPRRGLKRELRNPPRPVLLGVEPGKVLADDFGQQRRPLKRWAPGFQLVTMPSASSM